MAASSKNLSKPSESSAETRYTQQSARLSHLSPDQQEGDPTSSAAVEAKFITSSDPVIETADGSRLPAVPLTEAERLNQLKRETEQRNNKGLQPSKNGDSPKAASSANGESDSRSLQGHFPDQDDSAASGSGSAVPLRSAAPPAHTNPLFPPLPLYGPPSILRNIQCLSFRFSSFVLSLAFLGVIVLGSAFTSIPMMFRHMGLRLLFRDPDARRPFYEEEKRRRGVRREAAKAWRRQRRRRKSHSSHGRDAEEEAQAQGEDFEPTEGGHDPIITDIGYYARRVGLDVERFNVQTEDGFILDLWHVYNPKEYNPLPPTQTGDRGPHTFGEAANVNGDASQTGVKAHHQGKLKYPVLLMHGLLQSAGAYCTNDDDSLAFYLCKSGYDVWLGNNRCGFDPRHVLLEYSDPRMWAWNIRQMGVLDLPALVSRVLSETGFEKLGLVAHSQGTTQTFVALAKEQRPDLGQKISVFCALAPAVYAGPLIGKAYFKFMRMISPSFFRIFFGIHAFIPFMMTMHRLLPGRLYGALGYRVFSFLFDWTDARWDLDLRDRMFQFAPVYVSAESMRWWLGRECFAKHKCILATREESKHEELEDAQDNDDESTPNLPVLPGASESQAALRGMTSWYNDQAPPFALWVPGGDNLVDGRRLLRRFAKGREPHVKVVHQKVIEEYEHLDVIWAMDSIDQIGKEVRDVLWRTAPDTARSICRVPRGYNDVQQ